MLEQSLARYVFSSLRTIPFPLKLWTSLILIFFFFFFKILTELGGFEVKESKFRREMEKLRNQQSRDLTLEVKNVSFSSKFILIKSWTIKRCSNLIGEAVLQSPQANVLKPYLYKLCYDYCVVIPYSNERFLRLCRSVQKLSCEVEILLVSWVIKNKFRCVFNRLIETETF